MKKKTTTATWEGELTGDPAAAIDPRKLRVAVNLDGALLALTIDEIRAWQINQDSDGPEQESE